MTGVVTQTPHKAGLSIRELETYYEDTNYSNRNASQRKESFKSAKNIKSTKSSEKVLGRTTGTSNTAEYGGR